MATRKKICPALTATGPNGHVDEWIVDLKRKAVRCCMYVHDNLMHEFVLPIDTDVPMWGLNGEFIMVSISYFKFLSECEILSPFSIQGTSLTVITCFKKDFTEIIHNY